MARNKRKAYLDAFGDDERGIPCRNCGCRHNYVVKTEKIGATIRRTRRCRNCGQVFYTTEEG